MKVKGDLSAGPFLPTKFRTAALGVKVSVSTQLEACIAVCKSCGDECELHAQHGMEHCRVCAEECRSCEQACNELLQAIS
jgi:hypothetical protein